MDSFIRGYHRNCGSWKPSFHSRLRMHHTHQNHWLLSTHQLINKRHFISISVYSFHIKLRNHCRILVLSREYIGTALLFCIPILLLLFPFHATIDPLIFVLSPVCRKLQMEFCRWRGSCSTTMGTHHLSANDLVLLTCICHTNRILVDWSETKCRWLLQK